MTESPDILPIFERQMGRRGVLAVGIGAAVLGLAACTGRAQQGVNEENKKAQPQKDTVTLKPNASGVQEVEIDASDNYRFVPSTIKAQPGTIKLTLVNKAKSATHNLVFKPGGPTAEIPYLAPKSSKSITFDVTAAGDFPFVCTFHESLGQKGTLIVSA